MYRGRSLFLHGDEGLVGPLLHQQIKLPLRQLLFLGGALTVKGPADLVVPAHPWYLWLKDVEN